jgi:hypothetical protein
MQRPHPHEDRLVVRATEILDFGRQDGRLPRVTSVVTLACVAVLQQLQGAPHPGEVGQPVTVRASRSGEPLAGLPVHVELPDGSRQALGQTGVAGTLEFVPSVPGGHVLVAFVGGVEVLAPHPVVAERRRWPLAMACVPLGAVLLWRLSRARGRRGP